MLNGLEAGLREVVELHSKATDAMSSYRQASFHVPPKGTQPASGSVPQQCDTWLHEHRYRLAVGHFQDTGVGQSRLHRRGPASCGYVSAHMWREPVYCFAAGRTVVFLNA